MVDGSSYKLHRRGFDSPWVHPCAQSARGCGDAARKAVMQMRKQMHIGLVGLKQKKKIRPSLYDNRQELTTEGQQLVARLYLGRMAGAQKVKEEREPQ